MKFWCSSSGRRLDSDRYLPLCNTLAYFIRMRSPAPKRSARGIDRFLKILWTNRIMQRVGLRRILRDDIVRSTLPDGVQDCNDNMIICNPLTDGIGRLIFNYSKVARNLADPEPGLACPCSTLFPTAQRGPSGCVLSGDLSFIPMPFLRRRMELGPKFRENTHVDPMDCIREGLDSFIAWVAKDCDMPVQAFMHWRSMVLQRIQSNIGNGHIHNALPIGRSIFDQEVRALLTYLQRHLVFVPADKASNNIIAICRRWYVHKIIAELTQPDGAYSNVDSTLDDILQEHRDFLGPLNLFHRDTLPYLYPTPKLHKDPVDLRFISSSSNCSTTTLSKLLTSMLVVVKDTLQSKDRDLIRRTGVRRFFVVNSYDQVSHFLKGWVRNRYSSALHTIDFSKMYTTLPHKDLIARIGNVIREAARSRFPSGSLANVGIRATRRGDSWSCKWAKGNHAVHDRDSQFIPIKLFITLVAYLVNNSYVHARGILMRQTLGIPMGTNCAPLLADLYLYWYEANYIDRLLAKHQTAKARRFHLSFRLIDDLLSIDNMYWEDFKRSYEDGGVYPAALQPNDTTCIGYVNFLGMRISFGPTGKFVISVYDKRKDFPFRVRNYPYLESNVPTSQCYNVFLGQLCRFHRICTEKQDLLVTATDLANTLLQRGYSRNRLLRLFRRFCSTYSIPECTAVQATKEFRSLLSTET